MPKFYGFKVSVHGPRPYDFEVWQSTSEIYAVAKMESAQKIPAPLDHSATFELIETEVLVTAPGLYKLANGKKVRIDMIGECYATGHYLRANGRTNVSKSCTFYLNGKPHGDHSPLVGPVIETA